MYAQRMDKRPTEEELTEAGAVIAGWAAQFGPGDAWPSEDRDEGGRFEGGSATAAHNTKEDAAMRTKSGHVLKEGDKVHANHFGGEYNVPSTVVQTGAPSLFGNKQDNVRVNIDQHDFLKGVEQVVRPGDLKLPGEAPEAGYRYQVLH